MYITLQLERKIFMMIKTKIELLKQLFYKSVTYTGTAHNMATIKLSYFPS